MRIGAYQFSLKGLVVAGFRASSLSARFPLFRKSDTKFFPLSAMTVIYGRNGSGKSSFLQMLNHAVTEGGSGHEGVLVQVSDEQDRLVLRKILDWFCAEFADELVEVSEFNEFFDVANHVPTDFPLLESQRFDSGYTFADLRPFLAEWAFGGYFLATNSTDSRRFGPRLIPALAANLDDSPHTMNSFLQLNSGNAREMCHFNSENLAGSNRPIAVGRNYPGNFDRSLAMNFVLGDKQQLVKPSFIYLNEIPLKQMVELLEGRKNKTSGKDREVELGFVQEELTNLLLNRAFLFGQSQALGSVEMGVTPESSSIENGKNHLRNIYIRSIARDQAPGNKPSDFVLEKLVKLFPEWRDIELEFGTEVTRLEGIHPDWKINKSWGLSGASGAERRWLNFVAEALDAAGQAEQASVPRLLTLMDEPELGLHRQAEWEAAKVIEELSEHGNIVITTHSPVLLDINGAMVVNMKDGEFHELPTRSGELLAAGLRPSDLLGTCRGFLVVEGIHDKLIIEYLLGSVLEQQKVKIVHTDGAAKFSGLLASGFLFDYSRAPIIFALDNFNNETLAEAWREIKQHFDESRTKNLSTKSNQALKVLDRYFPDGSRNNPGELNFLKSAMRYALSSGGASRVRFIGFSKPDIQMYLPPHLFGLERSWETLHAEWAAEQNERRSKRIPFKSWLVDEKNNPFVTISSIKKALFELADEKFPADFETLSNVLLEI